MKAKLYLPIKNQAKVLLSLHTALTSAAQSRAILKKIRHLLFTVKNNIVPNGWNGGGEGQAPLLILYNDSNLVIIPLDKIFSCVIIFSLETKIKQISMARKPQSLRSHLSTFFLNFHICIGHEIRGNHIISYHDFHLVNEFKSATVIKKITFIFSSDFETLFTKHSPGEFLGLNFEKKTVYWNYNLPIQWSTIITPERTQWCHLLRMQCVKAAYSLCKTQVWESESSKLPCCILNKP